MLPLSCDSFESLGEKIIYQALHLILYIMQTFVVLYTLIVRFSNILYKS